MRKAMGVLWEYDVAVVSLYSCSEISVRGSGVKSQPLAVNVELRQECAFTAPGLQHALGQFSAACDQAGMKISAKKTRCDASFSSVHSHSQWPLGRFNSMHDRLPVIQVPTVS